MSLATVRRMEGAELRAIVVDGKHCFAIAEVDRHRTLTDGDFAAKAFEMFVADKTQVDVWPCVSTLSKLRALTTDAIGPSLALDLPSAAFRSALPIQAASTRCIL